MSRPTGRLATKIAALGLVVGLCGAASAAQEADTFAVVALVGDEIAVTFYQPAVGSSLDRNMQNSVKLPDDHFDRLAASVAAEAIHATLPDATSRTLALDDRLGFGEVGDPAGSDSSRQALLTAVRTKLGPSDTHYLLVIGKYRGDARLRVESGYIGSGKLSGLGFFVDANKRFRKTSTGERGRGFIGSYAYMMVTLVDLRSGAVVRSESAVETGTRANVGPDATLDPWAAMTAAEKVGLLDGLTSSALRRVVPQVVAPH